MSALTKIFVVLLAVMSVILSAGLIVFINRQENFKVAAEDMKKQLVQEQLTKNNVIEQIAVLKSQEAALATELSKQVTDGRVELARKDEDISKLAAQNTQLEQNLLQATAGSTSMSQALKVAQATINGQTENIGKMQVDDDKLHKQVVEDSNRITELTASLEVAIKHDRFMGEQNTQLAQQNASLSEVLRKYNLSPTGTPTPAGGAINNSPSINLNGIVREFKNLHGVPYATISLGRAESVTTGMQFKVIDPVKNQFLGYFTVDNVNDHESTGHLAGPNVAQVKPNVSEVRTQL